MIIALIIISLCFLVTLGLVSGLVSKVIESNQKWQLLNEKYEKLNLNILNQLDCLQTSQETICEILDENNKVLLVLTEIIDTEDNPSLN